MLAVPTRGQINWNVTQRLLELQAAHPNVMYHIESGGLSVSDVRNRIVKRFLQTACDVLIQVDDDVLPRLGVFEMADSAYDITGATYFIVRAETNLPFPGAFRYEGPHYAPIEKPFGRAGLVPCDAVASGCMAVKRKVFEHPDMRAPFAMAFDEDGVMQYSDDILFCHRARALGFTIAADYGHHADHIVNGISLNRIHHQYETAYARAASKPRIIIPG